jgi:hypothetical protein
MAALESKNVQAVKDQRMARFQRNFTGVISAIPYCAYRRHIPLCCIKYVQELKCLGSAWALCRWFLLLGHMGVAFIERRLSLLILFIIF